MERIGFIGLGIMGAPMAGHLLDAGYTVSTAMHRKPPAGSLLEKGLVVHATAREVAQASDVIITILPDTPQVSAVLFGEDGVAKALGPGQLLIDMSSISPIATQVFSARIRDRGSEFLDAPVSGGEIGAKAASLTIMAGGSEVAFERARPIFEKLGRNITLVGANGAGQTAKAANQIVVALTIQAVAEALLFASKAGVDPAKVRQALMGGLAASRILEVHGERMISRRFDPGFRIELHQKDLGLALDGAKAMGMSLPNTASTQQLFSACIANGFGGDDHSAIVKALEWMAGHAVGASAPA